jgi:uncharacterized HhH-GPD family protein
MIERIAAILQVRELGPAQTRDMARPRYPFTPDERANALLAECGTALLIGLCLEQQVRSEKAMIGPYVLRERIGSLEAPKIAKMPPARLEAVFREKPAIHRFPGMMAKRVRQLCSVIADEYGGDGARVWARVNDAPTLFERLHALPGFGEEKAACAVRILAKYGRRDIKGWQRYAKDEDLPWVFEDGERV